MFGSRRRLQERLADQAAQIEKLTEEKRELLEERDSVILRNRDLVVEIAEARTAAQRTHDRNRVLAELLEKARAAQGNEEYGRLEIRHERAVRAVARYLGELWRLRTVVDGHRCAEPLVPGLGEPLPEGGRVRPLSPVMRLELAARTMRDLDARVRSLQELAERQSRALRIAGGVVR